MPFLLDTNVRIEYLRGRNLPLRERMRAMDPELVLTCSIVVAELLYGAFRSNDVPGNLRLIEEFLADVETIPFDDESAHAFGLLKSNLQRKGMVIGPYDLQIAAVALVHGLTLVTGNVGEFSRVDGLTIENWR